MAEVPVAYFKKELPNSPLYLPSGQKVHWEVQDAETGLLATTDVGLIFQLNNAAAAHQGGVVRINQQEYEELKKNSQPQPVSLPEHGRQSLPSSPFRAAVRVEALPAIAEAQPNGNVAAAGSVQVQAPVPETPPVPAEPPTKTVRRGKLKTT